MNRHTQFEEGQESEGDGEDDGIVLLAAFHEEETQGIKKIEETDQNEKGGMRIAEAFSALGWLDLR